MLFSKYAITHLTFSYSIFYPRTVLLSILKLAAWKVYYLDFLHLFRFWKGHEKRLFYQAAANKNGRTRIGNATQIQDDYRLQYPHMPHAL